MAAEPFISEDELKAQWTASGGSAEQYKAMAKSATQRAAWLEACAAAKVAAIHARAEPGEREIANLAKTAYRQQIVAQSDDLKARKLHDPALPTP